MKMTSFLVSGCFIAGIFSTTVLALTLELPVTPADVREHPKEWSVKVAKQESGLIQFTIIRTLSEPKYLVAHLAVHHTGKLIATSDTPVFGKTKDNTFSFSIAAEDLGESTFDLRENGLGSTVNGVKVDDVPVVGGRVYQFRLLDFVPEEILKSARSK
jgi:hypothetical protein